jgi:hypothetical protein
MIELTIVKQCAQQCARGGLCYCFKNHHFDHMQDPSRLSFTASLHGKLRISQKSANVSFEAISLKSVATSGKKFGRFLRLAKNFHLIEGNENWETD